MQQATMQIDASEDRFSRFGLISWWDQKKLASARVLLIGVGALGNEILKNLALLGVGQVLVADLDSVELSNLSRSVLFRSQDCGKAKAEAAANSAKQIYPAMKLQPLTCNIAYDLGLGAYRWADVILAGLDNREARVAINQSAAAMGKLWIDGAIERLDGVARVFDPATGPCYACTMNDVDWQMLQARRSCALLSRDEIEAGKVPTTPTTASVIAGIQTQEAIKYLHGLDTLEGRGFVFDGTRHDSYVVTYSRKPDCAMHDLYEPIIATGWRVGSTTARQMIQRIRQDLGAQAVLEFNHDLMSGLHCPSCDTRHELFTSLGKVTQRQGHCPSCGQMCQPLVYHTLDGSEAWLDRTLGELGVPAWDIVGGRAGAAQCYYEFDGDREQVLGALS